MIFNAEINIWFVYLLYRHNVLSMNTYNSLFNKLWTDYTSRNPVAQNIYDLFVGEGEKVINDHIAFRTFDHAKINIDVLSQWFTNIGYEVKGEYHFEEKHLFAKHYELPEDEFAPRVFISQLITADFSDYLQQKVRDLVNKIPVEATKRPEILISGNLWEKTPSFEVYNRLRDESEYAAWLYLWGFTVNHFTVSVTNLQKLGSIEKTNEFLKTNGFLLNNSGGEIKGTPAELLEQSSIKANIVKMKFSEGEFDVPVTYFEFARRYRDTDGKLYPGFIAKSANKIFESTHFYRT